MLSLCLTSLLSSITSSFLYLHYFSSLHPQIQVWSPIIASSIFPVTQVLRTDASVTQSLTLRNAKSGTTKENTEARLEIKDFPMMQNCRMREIRQVHRVCRAVLFVIWRVPVWVIKEECGRPQVCELCWVMGARNLSRNKDACLTRATKNQSLMHF